MITGININLEDVLETARLGVRRAAAFLVVGLQVSSEAVPSVMRLDESMIGFFPEPIDSNARDEIYSEYRAWVIANALRELDMFYSIYLDKLYLVHQIVMLNDQIEAATKKMSKFSKDTNVASKCAKLASLFQIPSPNVDHMRRISLARNAFSHGAGHVSEQNASMGSSFLLLGAREILLFAVSQRVQTN